MYVFHYNLLHYTQSDEYLITLSSLWLAIEDDKKICQKKDPWTVIVLMIHGLKCLHA